MISPRRRVARRVVEEDPAKELWDDGRGAISLSALAKQAATAVLVAALGIVGVAGVSVASSPYATTVDRDAAPVAGAVDTSVGVPQANSNVSTAASSSLSNTDADDPDRSSDVTRSTLRTALSEAVAGSLANQRDDLLQQSGQQVASSAVTAAADQRAAALAAQAGQITGEGNRLVQQAQDQAAAAALAQAGTLVAQGKSDQIGSDPKLLAAINTVQSSTGWVTPLAAGTYHRGAGWGEYGSWARYHTGVDLSAPIGTPIRAVGPGVVMPATGGGWAGTHVVIMHSGGAQSLYAHMAMTTVKVGQVVKAGDLIGYVGMTGRTFGPHCHFEYYPPGARMGDPYTTANPVPWLLTKGVRL